MLYSMLDDHPAIQMSRPVRPEPKFFLNRVGAEDYQDYVQRVFPSIGDGVRYLGEKSTSYYERPEVAERISKVLPDSKLIVQLRDPVERALSNYDFSFEHGLETRSLEDVFLRRIPPPKVSFRTSVDPFDYVGRGEYVRHLRPYLRKFGDNLLVLKLDDVVHDLKDKRICDFLEIREVPLKADLASYRNEVPRTIASEEVRSILIEYFKPFNNELSVLTGLDVSNWNNPGE